MLVIRACIHNMLVLFCGFKNGCFSYKQKYVHKVLVNCLDKLAQEKSVVIRTDHPDMPIAVDWNRAKQKQHVCQNSKLERP